MHAIGICLDTLAKSNVSVSEALVLEKIQCREMKTGQAKNRFFTIYDGVPLSILPSDFSLWLLGFCLVCLLA
jgi:hypothetical protein